MKVEVAPTPSPPALLSISQLTPGKRYVVHTLHDATSVHGINRDVIAVGREVIACHKKPGDSASLHPSVVDIRTGTVMQGYNNDRFEPRTPEVLITMTREDALALASYAYDHSPGGSAVERIAYELKNLL